MNYVFPIAMTLVALSLFTAASAEQLTIGDKTQTKSVEVSKQVQIAADLHNSQDIPQDFAYIVQIQNEDGVTVSLAWLTGTLTPAQALSPAISWIPEQAGTYEATIFVWESIDNPTALSPTLSLRIDVGQSA